MELIAAHAVDFALIVVTGWSAHVTYKGTVPAERRHLIAKRVRGAVTRRGR